MSTGAQEVERERQELMKELRERAQKTRKRMRKCVARTEVVQRQSRNSEQNLVAVLESVRPAAGAPK